MATRKAVVLVVLLSASIATTTTAMSPRGGELNGLSPSDAATLWSLDTDTTQSVSGNQTTGSSSAMQELAARTDITFSRPPGTAATWTRNDFRDLRAGGAETARYPPHADRENGTYLADAHATLFAIQPSTVMHLDPTTTRRYVAPTGTVRGFIDYRIRHPPDTTTGNRTTRWRVVSHDIERVELRADDTTIATSAGSHTPMLDYRLDTTGPTTLTLEAGLSVTLERTTINQTTNQTTITRSLHTESLTVSDTITVEPYALAVEATTASYPDGSMGLAVFQSQPWHGIKMDDRGVRGVWRYYTARNPAWDTLVSATDSSRTRRPSPSTPVSVHAYPSRIGPQTYPVRDGPRLHETWGVTRNSPASGLPDTINVDVVTEEYATSYGLAIDTDTEPASFRIQGVVRGVNTTIQPSDRGRRDVHESTLTVDITNQSLDAATLRFTLTDTETGRPIVLDRNPIVNPLDAPSTGYILVAGERLQTNSSGVATITLDEPGSYTARYVPGSWLDSDPAYAGDTTPVRWHPLTTSQGWLALTTTLLWQLSPLLAAAYAGHRLLTTLTTHQ